MTTVKQADPAAEETEAAGDFVLKDGALVLVSCPPGFLLVNASLESQQCKKCPAYSYSFNHLDGCIAEESTLVCGVRNCQACPVRFPMPRICPLC